MRDIGRARTVRERRERGDDEERPLDAFHRAHGMQQCERLRRLPKSHFIAKDDVALKVPVEAQPVEPVDLVRPQRPPTRKSRRLGELRPTDDLQLLLLLLLLLLPLLLLSMPFPPPFFAVPSLR